MLKIKPTVLIVDDLQETRQIMYQFLSLEFDILQTSTIDQAIFYCSQMSIDVVITDLNFEMSDSKTGFDLILELKRLGFQGKIVAMSGYYHNLNNKEEKILNSIDCFFKSLISLSSNGVISV